MPPPRWSQHIEGEGEGEGESKGEKEGEGGSHTQHIQREERERKRQRERESRDTHRQKADGHAHTQTQRASVALPPPPPALSDSLCLSVGLSVCPGGPGIACPADDVVPSNLKAGANCGGACNLIGNCAAGLECVVPEAPTMGMPLRGVALGSATMMQQRVGTCTAVQTDDRECGGCEEVEGGTDADHDGVVDTYDEMTVNSAKAAVGLIDAQSNDMYGSQFIRIVPGSVHTQVVAGTKYTMDIEVGETACRNSGDGTTLSAEKCPVTAGGAVRRYHVEIVDVPWQRPPYQLLSFRPVDATANTNTATLAGGAAKPGATDGAVIAGQAQGPRLGRGGSCGDGSMQMCMVMMMCPPNTMSAVMNGCTSCVDPHTCLASNGH